MRLTCRLREIRGDRSLSEIQAASGINRATLSQIERGVMLPLEKQLQALEEAYGAPFTEWYSRLGLAAIQESEAA